jgi:hypothetical protein
MDTAQAAARLAATHLSDSPAPVRQTSPLLLKDVFLNVASCLGPNERACLLRALCKEARDLLPDATVLNLSHAVPEAAFAAMWGQPGAVRHLTQARREELMCLTAKSGVLANCGCWRGRKRK